jgi:hypothetical protein
VFQEIVGDVITDTLVGSGGEGDGLAPDGDLNVMAGCLSAPARSVLERRRDFNRKYEISYCILRYDRSSLLMEMTDGPEC